MTPKELIAAGYRQVSYKYRRVARLPPGMTGLQALAAVDPNLAQHFLDNAERTATEQFLRVYSKDVIALSSGDFAEFRRILSLADARRIE